MAAIQDLVLTFCPKMHCVPQRKLKLLMPVWIRSINLSFPTFTHASVLLIKTTTQNRLDKAKQIFLYFIQ